MKPILHFFVAILLSVALINCKTMHHQAASKAAAKDTIPGKPNAELAGTYWKLTELNGQKIETNGQFTHEPYMILQFSDSSIKGNGGCNGFGGKFEWKANNRIRFSGIVSTMMACEKMQVENEYFQVLKTVDNYNLIADTLILNRARMAPLARFQAVYLK